MVARPALVSRIVHGRDHELLRYGFASGGALAVDMASFLGLLALRVPAGMAAALAYSLGMATHWVLLSRSVFEHGVAPRSSARRTQQKWLFVLTTLGGLALTTALVSAADLAGLNVRAIKAFAVGLSFFLNYGVRKRFVFAAGDPAVEASAAQQANDG
jgi:putative flippase GtrA